MPTGIELNKEDDASNLGKGAGNMGWLPKWDFETAEPNQWSSLGDAKENPGFL